MITRTLRNALIEIAKREVENPEDAACLEPSLRILRAHIDHVIQFVAQPTLEDLEAETVAGNATRSLQRRTH